MQISASILDAEHLSAWPKRSRGSERRCKIRLRLESGIAAQPLRLSCLYHTPGDRVAAVIPSAERWMPSSTRLSEWILTISDRRRGHAKQVRRGDPSQFQSDVGSRAFGRSAQGGERS